MTSATDNFNRTDGALGSNWVHSPDLDTPVIANNVAAGSTASSWGGAYWSPSVNAFANDQSSQVTMPPAAGASWIGSGALVRHQTASGHSDCYIIASLNAGSVGTFCYRLNSGTFTQIGSTWVTTVSNGQIVKLSVTGTSLTGTVDVGTNTFGTDATYSGGQPGIVTFGVPTVGVADDDWTGDPITAIVFIAAAAGIGSASATGRGVGTISGVATAAGIGDATSGPRVIPSDRLALTNWQNAGMMSRGGIPVRSTIFTTLSPSGGDDSAMIQAAINNCPVNQVVLLNAGTFIVNNFLLINKGIVLRGQGPGVTILYKTNGATPRTTTLVPGTVGIYQPQDQAGIDVQPIVLVGEAEFPFSDSTTSQNLTVDGTQGSTSVTIANAAGFTAGQIVLLDEISLWSYQTVPPGYAPPGIQVKVGDHVVFQMHNPSQSWDDPPNAFGWFSRGYPSNTSSGTDTDGRMTCEIKEIASVSGNTITFTSPLTIGYRTSHLAQLTRYVAGANGGNGGAPIFNAGIEELTFKGGGNGNLRFEVAAYCWAKHIEVTQWRNEGIALDNCFRVEIRDSYIHTGSEPEPGGGGYAISLAAGSSEILIENNISRDVNKVMVSRCSGAGCVVAYNYMDDGFINTSPTFQEIGLNSSHMAGPHHTLFEGNWCFNMDTDYTHGSSQFMTYFRNYTTGQRASWIAADVNSRCAGVSTWAKKFSFIGNLLGRPGMMSGWDYTDPMMGCDVNGDNCVSGVVGSWGSGGIGNIWQIGYDATNQWSQEAELGALSTVIRDGNYDFLTNSQRWHNTPATFVIPNSLYLSSRPAFFGASLTRAGLPWPWTDPSTGAIFTLPAKATYDALSAGSGAGIGAASGTGVASGKSPAAIVSPGVAIQILPQNFSIQSGFNEIITFSVNSTVTQSLANTTIWWRVYDQQFGIPTGTPIIEKTVPDIVSSDAPLSFTVQMHTADTLGLLRNYYHEATIFDALGEMIGGSFGMMTVTATKNRPP